MSSLATASNGYRLTELPAQLLEDVSARYPLRLDEEFSSEYEDLLITVVIHGELSPR